MNYFSLHSVGVVFTSPDFIVISNEDVSSFSISGCFQHSHKTEKKRFLLAANVICHSIEYSKVLEKVVAHRLKDHLTTHGLLEPCQSAYGQFHSIETALVKIHSDLAVTLDKN